MNFCEETIKSKILYDGLVVKLMVDEVKLINEKTSCREVIDHQGGVAVAALTDDNELLLIRQFRYPFREAVLELPAGKLEKEQSPLENGIRELFEETGAVGYDYQSLGTIYPSPGYCNEIVHLYFCRVKSISAPNPDEDEFLTMVKIKLQDAVNMVLENKIPDAKTQIGILKTAFIT